VPPSVNGDGREADLATSELFAAHSALVAITVQINAHSFMVLFSQVSAAEFKNRPFCRRRELLAASTTADLSYR
jgi:hypothetical protein